MEPWEPPAPPDSNTFRIFISTDNHLGYAENCDYPPRQQDSFRAVEEVLENATNSEAILRPTPECSRACSRAPFWR